MLKRLPVAAVCVALAAAVVAPNAVAGHGGGVKKGHTAQGRKIRVKFYRRFVEIKNFSIKLHCKGGYKLIDLESGFLPSPLRGHNHIRDRQKGSTDVVLIRGRLTRRRVHGAIRVRDHLGKHRCDSHWVRFAVRR